MQYWYGISIDKVVTEESRKVCNMGKITKKVRRWYTKNALGERNHILSAGSGDSGVAWNTVIALAAAKQKCVNSLCANPVTHKTHLKPMIIFYKHCTLLLTQQDILSKFFKSCLSEEMSKNNNLLDIPVRLQLLLFHHLRVFQKDVFTQPMLQFHCT